MFCLCIPLSLTSSVTWKACHVFRVCCDWCCHGVTLCVNSIVKWRFEIRFCFEDKIWLRFFILTYVCGFLTSVTNTGVSSEGGVPRHYAYLFWVVGGGMGPPSIIHFEVRFFLFEKIYPPCPLWKHNVGHWCVGMPHIMGFPTHLASCSNLHILHDYMFCFVHALPISHSLSQSSIYFCNGYLGCSSFHTSHTMCCNHKTIHLYAHFMLVHVC